MPTFIPLYTRPCFLHNEPQPYAHQAAEGTQRAISGTSGTRTRSVEQLRNPQRVHVHLPGGIRRVHRRPLPRVPPPGGRPALPPRPRRRHVATRRLEVRPPEGLPRGVLVGGRKRVALRPPVRKVGRRCWAPADVREGARGAALGAGPGNEVPVAGSPGLAVRGDRFP